ncbi:ferric reductase-like transmembrane domain-containing protein [Candidatus Roizmanbacteria bacterium]|nr:ferric reductase-like transmembrane domain-containing protein [Candidatus Roizmanbacteria bacterium]
MNKEQIRQYFLATIFGFVLFILLSGYLFLRRGYYDLYIINKVFAGVSLIILATVVLIGPLSRLYDRFDSWIIYRKELGIVAFLLALAHGVISFFFLSDRFSVAYFMNNLLTFIFGLISLFILAYLFILSFERIINFLDRKKWWLVQSWGVRIAGILAFLHVFLLKYPGWLKWYTQGGSPELARPYLPPASIVAFSFALFVVLVRLAEFFGKKAGRIMVILLFCLLMFFLIGSFLWGS